MIFTDPSTYLRSADPGQSAVDAFDADAIADQATERARNWLASSAFTDRVNEMNDTLNREIENAINDGRNQMGNIKDTSNMINAGINLAGGIANKIGSNNTSNLSSDSVRDAFTNGLNLDLGIDYNSQFMNTPGLSFNPFSKI